MKDEAKIREAVAAMQGLANAAAGSVHRETGAPYVVVILAGGGGPLVAGGWVPATEVMRKMAADLVEALDSGTSVRDMRKGRQPKQ